MSAMFPAYTPDKDDIRSRLDLAFVCNRYGITLNRDDRAICPFHDDRDPSFYLWEGDDGHPRWWCQVCGFGGDVFDFIMRMDGVIFPDALRRAAALLDELPPDYIPPRISTSNRPDPSSFEDEVNQARALAAQEDHHGILAMRTRLVPPDADRYLASRWDAYLRGTWGWGIRADGSVLVPHWDPDSRLVGCKVRLSGSKKGSLPGSTYDHLYGSWLGRRHREVFIAEGESDAAYAGFAAAEEGIAIDIFAMPSGANQPISPLWLDFLSGTSMVYLALDPDVHGVEAARRWIESLDSVAGINVRVCCLPLDRDLRDTRPPLRDLLNAAKRPLLAPPVMMQPGGFVRTAQNGNPIVMTTWTIDPVATLTGDDPGYDVILHSRGTKRRAVIRLLDFASAQSLNKWANQYQEVFLGTDNDRKEITAWVEARASVTPEIFQTSRVGLHDPPARYVFAGRTVVLPTTYYGKLPWRYAPFNRTANVSDRVLIPTEDEVNWRWVSAFLKLSTPDVTHPLLAWLCAAARRPEFENFPILFIGGSSGVGKSTLASTALRLMGSKIEIDLGSATPFVLFRTLASTTSLPVFVDEWTRLSRREAREAFQGVVPILYAGGQAERGMADLGTQVYPMTSPVIVAGEDTFSLDREMDRSVRIYPSHANQNARALTYLHDSPIQAFGQRLHRFIAEYGSLPRVNIDAANRVEYNRQVLLTGWATLRAFMDDAAGHDPSVPDIPEEPDLSCFERNAEYSEDDENVYITAALQGFEMSDANGGRVCWEDSEGRGTWVRFMTLIGLIETRRIDVQLPGRSQAMRKYFRERFEVLSSRETTPPDSLRRVRADLVLGFHRRDFVQGEGTEMFVPEEEPDGQEA